MSVPCAMTLVDLQAYVPADGSALKMKWSLNTTCCPFVGCNATFFTMFIHNANGGLEAQYDADANLREYTVNFATVAWRPQPGWNVTFAIYSRVFLVNVPDFYGPFNIQFLTSGQPEPGPQHGTEPLNLWTIGVFAAITIGAVGTTAYLFSSYARARGR